MINHHCDVISVSCASTKALKVNDKVNNSRCCVPFLCLLPHWNSRKATSILLTQILTILNSGGPLTIESAKARLSAIATFLCAPHSRCHNSQQSTMPTGKSILISGAAQGIGRCLARHFLEKGNRVFILDVNEDELKYTASVHLKKHASNLDYSLCNLRDVKEIRRTVTKAADFFGGRIDVLINNGGIAAPQWKDGKSMDDPDTFEQWNAYIETNLTAPFAVSQACIPYMKEPKEKDIKDHGS